MDDLGHSVPLQDELCDAITTMDHEVLILVVEQHHTKDTAIAKVKYRIGHLQAMFSRKTNARSDTRVRALWHCNGDVSSHERFTTSRHHMVICTV